MKILEFRPNPPIVRDSHIRFSCQLIRKNAGDTESVSELWYEISREIDISWKREDVEPYLIATILLAMQEERRMLAKGSVSAELLSNLTEFCDFWNNCLPKLFKKITIECESIERPGDVTPIHKAVSTFSGGLDGTFVVWRHVTKQAGYRTQPLSGCVMIHGFDIPLSMDELFNMSFSVGKKTLESVGLPLIWIRTNILEAVPVHLGYSHGALLVSSLQFLKSKFDVALVASSMPYVELVFPWGSSPLTDHLLSSGGFKVMHDGAGYSRSEKAQGVSEWTEGIANLRVCLTNEDPSLLNCGRCEKCVRTMACFAVNRLPIPKCLNGNLDTLNRRVKFFRLHSAEYVTQWTDLMKKAKQNKIRDPWVKWIPLLFVKYRIRQARKRIKEYFGSWSIVRRKK